MESFKNKKIMIVNSDFSPSGGAEWIAYKTYKILKESGIDAYFFASNRQPFFEADYEFKDYFTRFIGNTKQYLKNPFKYYFNTEAQRDFQKFVNKINPDIIHLHSFRVTMTSSILKICENIPTIMTVHDAGIICPAGTLMYKAKNICKNKECLGGKYIHCLQNKCCGNNLEINLRKTLRAYIFRNQYQKYIDQYITPSNALKLEIINANIGIDNSDISTINNFLSNEEFETSPNYSNKGFFLYIGRLSKEKGLNYLLEALRDLPRAINLKIVGTGEEENKLKQYTKENNLYNVEFTGFKNRNDIKEYYQNCIATILPCNWFENFPTTTMESFINGKPVIASKLGGLIEQIEHNKTGLLFEPTNVAQLKECILLYANDNRIVTQHGKNAYEYARKKFSEERYLEELLFVYETSLNKENI